jgi:glycosyltransferase involved in cell wall biosynthesis
MAMAHEFDLWQFEWLAYADAVADVPNTRTVVIAHNVESLIWKRYWQTESSAVKALYLKEQYRKFRSFERRVFSSVTGVVCVSEEDAKLALSEFSPRRVWVVDNGIDRAYFEQASGERAANTILFLGSLEWRPNLDAVKVLLDSIFPEVRRMMPQAKLQIVGRRPPQWLKDVAGSTAGVELFADVADVRPYLASASVMAVPLRVGGGSRLKILEGLACGLPVVSTPVGCEGLAIRHGQELTVVEEPRQFAKALCDAISEPEQARAMADAGRRLVYEKYDWDVLAGRLETTWDQVSRFSPAKSTWETPAGAQPAMG